MWVCHLSILISNSEFGVYAVSVVHSPHLDKHKPEQYVYIQPTHHIPAQVGARHLT